MSINLISPVGKTGYGVVGNNLLKTLVERGVKVSLFNKGNLDRNHQNHKLHLECMKNAAEFDYEAPCLSIWHQFDLAMSVGRGKYAAYPFFELDTFNEREKHHLRYPDQLLASSKWAKDMLHANLGESLNVEVVSPGVDEIIFNHRITPKKRTIRNVVFFNCGKWEVRKGHDILGDIFNKAFDPEAHVELWLMPHNPFLTISEAMSWSNLYMDTPLGRAGKIKILPWVNSQEELARIMSVVDCGIFPSRAEGWNLELLEMMSMGKPVIATNYSAHTEFCNDKNCHLIEIFDLESAYDGRWFHNQGNWAKIGSDQIDAIVSTMRQVQFNTLQSEEFLVNKEGIATAQEFSWNSTAEKVEQLLLTS